MRRLRERHYEAIRLLQRLRRCNSLCEGLGCARPLCPLLVSVSALLVSATARDTSTAAMAREPSKKRASKRAREE
jgi:hypothetical protein